MSDADDGQTLRAAQLAARIAEATANGQEPDSYDVKWLDNHWRMLRAVAERGD